VEPSLQTFRSQIQFHVFRKPSIHPRLPARPQRNAPFAGLRSINRASTAPPNWFVISDPSLSMLTTVLCSAALCACELQLNDLLEKQYGSADFGSHGCPWECGLRLLYLRGAETGPNGRGAQVASPESHMMFVRHHTKVQGVSKSTL
ncbi:hypothetical protein JOQ06_012785, partial [Pogonophryne albipinna]